jgi:hypothetical protein
MMWPFKKSNRRKLIDVVVAAITAEVLSEAQTFSMKLPSGAEAIVVFREGVEIRIPQQRVDGIVQFNTTIRLNLWEESRLWRAIHANRAQLVAKALQLAVQEDFKDTE